MNACDNTIVSHTPNIIMVVVVVIYCACMTVHCGSIYFWLSAPRLVVLRTSNITKKKKNRKTTRKRNKHTHETKLVGVLFFFYRKSYSYAVRNQIHITKHILKTNEAPNIHKYVNERSVQHFIRQLKSKTVWGKAMFFILNVFSVVSTDTEQRRFNFDLFPVFDI